MTLISAAGQSRAPAAPAWRRILREAVRRVDELERLLELPPGALASTAAPQDAFPLRVPRGFVARMRKGDPHDPLLRQILPLRAEHEHVAGFDDDPLAERAVAQSGVLRKYAGRALLIASGACPVHCRYCFRRAFPYAAQLAAREGFDPAMDALRRDPGVTEVILSGGDPLSLGDRKLGELIAAVESVPQVKTLRLHTRFPIMIPERVGSGLLSRLAGTALRVVVVVHANHANELDAGVAEALGRLGEAAHAVLNQSVLLRGVNDDVRTLADLSERLLDTGVLPYYLHLLDPVAGAAHFAVPDAEGARLVEELRRRLPGYLVPRLVREVPGQLSKTPILLSAGDRCDGRTVVSRTQC